MTSPRLTAAAASTRTEAEVRSARKMEPVDLGYCFFCASRGVERDPISWLHASKDEWIKMAQAFIRMAGLKQ